MIMRGLRMKGDLCIKDCFSGKLVLVGSFLSVSVRERE